MKNLTDHMEDEAVCGPLFYTYHMSGTFLSPMMTGKQSIEIVNNMLAGPIYIGQNSDDRLC